MTQLQKWGGAAALYEALAYIIGIVGFMAVVNVTEIADPVARCGGHGRQSERAHRAPPDRLRGPREAVWWS
ncbi:MAG: hypothetical protein R2854_08415 [Caldilineaceae bacterium]